MREEKNISMQKETYKFTKYETNSIKLIAVILMLAHHLFSFPDRIKETCYYNSLLLNSDNKTIEMELASFGKICVALFLLLGGYGLFQSYVKDKTHVNKMLIKRIFNLYKKVWQIFIIFIPVGIFIGAEIIPSDRIIYLLNFFAIDISINNEWWFLTQYILLMVISPFLFEWIDRKNSNILKDIVYITLLRELSYFVLIQFIKTCPYLAEFASSYAWKVLGLLLDLMPIYLFGAYLAKWNIVEKCVNSIQNKWIKKIVGMALILVCYCFRQEWSQTDSWGMDQFDMFYAAIFTVACALLLENNIKLKDIMCFFGKHTTGVWLIHTFFCYYYFQEFIFYSHQPVVILLTLYLASWLSDVAITSAFSGIGRCVEKLKNII